MKISDLGDFPTRKTWLKAAEQDLARRLEQRVATFEGAWHANDPLYQRLWFALARVRRELLQAEQPLPARVSAPAEPPERELHQRHGGPTRRDRISARETAGLIARCARALWRFLDLWPARLLGR
jgi:hypothetical protein